MREKAAVCYQLDLAAARQEGRAEAVIAVLAARGLDVPESLRAQILSCRSTAALDRWLTRAATCAAADELGDAGGGESGAAG
ncbi:MAG: hypothetical protein HY744_11505 [Deltaproteobacteria bacterium]|nr:hypothetical protein [Deltaproteobacteria bacterium]